MTHDNDPDPKTRLAEVTLRFKMQVPVTSSGLTNTDWLDDRALDALESPSPPADLAIEYAWAEGIPAEDRRPRIVAVEKDEECIVVYIDPEDRRLAHDAYQALQTVRSRPPHGITTISGYGQKGAAAIRTAVADYAERFAALTGVERVRLLEHEARAFRTRAHEDLVTAIRWQASRGPCIDLYRAWRADDAADERWTAARKMTDSVDPQAFIWRHGMHLEDYVPLVNVDEYPLSDN